VHWLQKAGVESNAKNLMFETTYKSTAGEYVNKFHLGEGSQRKRMAACLCRCLQYKQHE